MTYEELLTELIQLRGCANILVTGPQRSGTTIMARALSHDLDLYYCDEDEHKLGWGGTADGDIDILYGLLSLNSGYVVQAPARAHICHLLPSDTAIVFCRRRVEDIVASQERIGWEFEDFEISKYPEEWRRRTAAETKYAYWEGEQRYQVAHGYDVEYESLRGHHLWVEDRAGFTERQWR